MNAAFICFCLSLTALLETGCSVSIVSRGSWKARSTKGSGSISSAVGRVFVHHSVTPACNSLDSCGKQLRSIQNYHIDNQKWGDIGYSFLIGGDGRIYEGRGWRKVGAHTINYNSKAYGICFIGNFETQQPSVAMMKALKDLITEGIAKKYISTNYKINGHRDVSATACPGKILYQKIKTMPRFDKSLG